VQDERLEWKHIEFRPARAATRIHRRARQVRQLWQHPGAVRSGLPTGAANEIRRLRSDFTGQGLSPIAVPPSTPREL